MNWSKVKGLGAVQLAAKVPGWAAASPYRPLQFAYNRRKSCRTASLSIAVVLGGRLRRHEDGLANDLRCWLYCDSVRLLGS
jgi:hypothetical protein